MKIRNTRAALVSFCAICEEYKGPLTHEMIESAKRIIVARETEHLDNRKK